MENIQSLQKNQYLTCWEYIIDLNLMVRIFEFILSDEFLLESESPE